MTLFDYLFAPAAITTLVLTIFSEIQSILTRRSTNAPTLHLHNSILHPSLDMLKCRVLGMAAWWLFTYLVFQSS